MGWGRGGDPRKSTTINDTDTAETEQETQRRLLAGRTADGQRPEPTPPPTDAPSNPYYASPPPFVYAKPPSLLERWKAKGGIVGGIASALLLLLKVGLPALALLAKLKFLLGAGSMLVSMWAWGLLYGWPFGIGLVLLIFVHECGHAFAARLRGIPIGAMVFVPFMGAFVTMKRGGKDAAEGAFIGIMGPVFGLGAGLACLLIFCALPSPFWLALAQWSFMINLFNLLPIPPLDGSRLLPVFKRRTPTGEGGPPGVTSADRWKYGVAYVGLAALLAALAFGLHSSLHLPAVA